jgi:hypothetical protein
MHITNIMPFSIFHSQPGPINKSATEPGSVPSSTIANLAPIKAALSRWRNLWFMIKEQHTPEEWTKVGLFKNGYNYWLITQMIVNHKGGAEVLMNMEVPCDDTLAQYR